jgi:hypothetical protein
MTGPPLAKSVGMSLLNAFAAQVQSAKFGRSFPVSPFSHTFEDERPIMSNAA